MRSAPVVAILWLTLTSVASTQQPSRSQGGAELGVQGLWSSQLTEGAGSDDHTFGVGVGFAYGFPLGIAVEVRGSYRSWQGESYIPLHLGVRYDLPVLPLLTLAPFAGFGPSLVWGNDWGSVFASFDLGARAYVALKQDARVRLLLEVSYGQGMAFHPSSFDVVTVGGGVTIGL